ncbi:unnamed protein product [Sphagnum tenellum]
MPAYFEADRSGKQRVTINIGKDIVETVVLGLLFDVDVNDVASASRVRAIFKEGHNFDDSFGVSMLDLRIRILDIHNFHMLAVPMFVEHSGEEMFKSLSDSLSALDLDWKMKIVGITTDGAASMTGVRKGIVSRIQAVATKGLIRVWWDAHQLDLALKKALGRLSEAFLTTLTTMIVYL